MQGAFPLSESLDHIGLFATDVESVALAWHALTGTVASAGSLTDAAPLTIGRPTEAYWSPRDEAITAAVDAAALRLRELGHRVVEVTMPGVEEFPGIYRRIGGAEAWATHADWAAQQPEGYQPATLERIRAGGAASAREYIDARRRREQIRTDIAAALVGVDAILVPTTPIRAPRIGELFLDGDIDVRALLLSLCSPFNLIGCPSISVPGAPSAGELPTGVQLAGVGLSEARLLALAAAIDAS